MKDLHIDRLGPSRASAVCRLLTADDLGYRQHFVPFEPTIDVVEKILGQARADAYWGIEVDRELAGLVMLRGLDEGYEVPAFGVYIARAHAGRGLSKLALEFATAWSRVNGCSAVMLSVHPDNAIAVRTYESAGFTFTGRLSRIGHRVYEKKLTP